ncbi:hypothetical protein [Hymenobacter rigui]|uniref:Outer membrane protein beta-barrel domain-containing protein n=1 Tax=Hymenobacter rigui TaxID=334424 RepID=A0A428KKH5_9BACT|nr:hypothetical protein [Hymenobacter rigui]RSK46874.1 hypothetical protein EI291_17680 [Hymenobacter rigui]
MKRIVLFTLFAGLATAAQAQQTEFSVQATSGYFGYRGESATNTSQLILSDVAQIPHYTNNPYGNRFTLSYGGAGQVQRVTAGGLLMGVQAGYEWLRSRVNIDRLYGDIPSGDAASGHAILTNSSIQAHGFIGWRFRVRQMELDATLGPEVGFRQHLREKAEATNGTSRYTTDTERYASGTPDVRARLNLTAYYHRFGVAVGYSHGLSNYRAGFVGGTNDLYSRMLRLGLVCRLVKS